MIDVSDLVVDPDFATTVDVLRRTQTVGADGVAVLTPSRFNCVVGVVTSEGNPFEQNENASYAANSITVHTQFRLYPPTGGFQPDVILFQGNSYQVRTVANYGQFGYYKADADMIELQESVNDF